MQEVFQCRENSLRNLFHKGSKDQMFLQIEDSYGDIKLRGKAYITNEEGKNEYISQFEHFAKDIVSVTKGEFQGNDALILSVRIKTVYGSNQKSKIIIPNLGANLNRALGIITNYVKEI